VLNVAALHQAVFKAIFDTISLYANAFLPLYQARHSDYCPTVFIPISTDSRIFAPWQLSISSKPEELAWESPTSDWQGSESTRRDRVFSRLVRKQHGMQDYRQLAATKKLQKCVWVRRKERYIRRGMGQVPLRAFWLAKLMKHLNFKTVVSIDGAFPLFDFSLSKDASLQSNSRPCIAVPSLRVRLVGEFFLKACLTDALPFFRVGPSRFRAWSIDTASFCIVLIQLLNKGFYKVVWITQIIWIRPKGQRAPLFVLNL